MTDHVDHASPRAPKRGLRKKMIIGAALAGMASVAGLAFAEWLATGTGEGYAKSRTAEPLTTESVTAAASLYPGGTGDLVIRVHNPNPFAVTLTSVTPNGAITSDSAACDAGGHGVSFTGVTGLSNLIGANATTDVTLTGALSMAPTSANECQGVTFTVPVSLNGGSGGGANQTWYADTDADTFGDPNSPIEAPAPPAGFVADGTDCDDSHSTVHPNAPEVADGLDNDCDGTIDEGLALQTWYLDVDADGFGNPASFTEAAQAPSGYVADNTDCDDSNDLIHPDATETLEGIDADCDGAAAMIWWSDFDDDAFGDINGAVILADSRPDNFSFDNTDCDDTNASIHPGATEVLGDGKDNDCDGTIDEIS